MCISIFEHVYKSPVVDVLLPHRGLRSGLAVDLLVRRQHVVQLLHLLAPLSRQNPLEHRLRDSARLLQVEHLE